MEIKCLINLLSGYTKFYKKYFRLIKLGSISLSLKTDSFLKYFLYYQKKEGELKHLINLYKKIKRNTVSSDMRKRVRLKNENLLKTP
jgi:hypothetical protein